MAKIIQKKEIAGAGKSEEYISTNNSLKNRSFFNNLNKFTEKIFIKYPQAVYPALDSKYPELDKAIKLFAAIVSEEITIQIKVKLDGKTKVFSQRGFPKGLNLNFTENNYNSAFRQNNRKGLVQPWQYLDNYFLEAPASAEANCVEKSLLLWNLYRSQEFPCWLEYEKEHIYVVVVLYDVVYEAHANKNKDKYLFAPSLKKRRRLQGRYPGWEKGIFDVLQRWDERISDKQALYKMPERQEGKNN